MSRTTPVVALFGSTTNTGLAKLIGAEIARRDCILLTGGGRGPTGLAVTEAGLEGAEAARRDDDVLGARIGVLGRQHQVVGVEVEDKGTKIILSLAVGDRRNYANAHLCDAAIALDGGDGTKSEVAFCLALGRPVLLVGPRWSNEFPLTTSQSAYDAFVRAAQHRVPIDDRDELDGLIGRAYARLTSNSRFVVSRFSLDTPPGLLAKNADEAATSTGPAGSLPDLKDVGRRVVAAGYTHWLTEMDRMLHAARTTR